MIVLTSNDDSTYEGQSRLYRLLPHYGITLPLTRAITCHCQTQNDTSGTGINNNSLFYSSLFTKSAETPINTGVARCEEWRRLLTLASF